MTLTTGDPDLTFPGEDAGPRRRRWPLLLLAAVLAVVVAAVSTVLLLPPSWASGASGDPTDEGFASWRGSELEVAGTWIDSNEGQLGVWPLQPKGEYDRWTGDLDVAVGAISWEENWEQAAQGAYDERWRTSLETIAELWDRRERGQLYLRFAHEMNGSWYSWKVTADSTEDFKAAWKRYRALQEEVLPEAELVFSVNRESVDTGIDWREMFPGQRHVDVVAVDYYNHFPNVATKQAWDEELRATDQWGAPKGLLAHQEFARSVGLPLALSEWGNNAEHGDSPLFVREMRTFFEENAGDGPGELLYEIYFNPQGAEDGKWELWPDTRQPDTAKAYREVF